MIQLTTILIFLSVALFAKEYQYTNSLINSNSPYLKQHAHNPINWYEWNQKSLSQAKKEDKLIFLSIGYSTCHWCHVMEKESFMDEELAKEFNKYYINIKVDREIQSDLDLYYQEVLSSIGSRRNGWPLSVIMTPELEVLYIATYIPKSFKYGVEGLDTLLSKFHQLYKDKKELLKLLNENKKRLTKGKRYTKKVVNNLEKEFIKSVKIIYDDDFKGFFKIPRFPHSATLTTLYDIYDLRNDKSILKMVLEPLTAMAQGGIYDQVEGGFFRYSVHRDWIVPHFEKMLYTSAELIPIYVRAYQQTKDPLYKKVVLDTLDEIENRFVEDGLFFSASNADSDGLEGRYFIYSFDEAIEALLENGFTQADAESHLEYLDITPIGNFEDEFSNPHFNSNFKEDKKPSQLEKTVAVLKKLREKREYPFIDKKIITSWNAMMIKTYLNAGVIEKKYLLKGLNYLSVLLKNLDQNSQLYHYKMQKQPLSQKAILEDYAFLADTLLTAYEKTYDKKYLKLARGYFEKAKKLFYKNKKWYLSDSLLQIEGNFIDKYYTSALSKILSVGLSLASLEYNLELYSEIKQTLKNYEAEILSNIDNHPSGVNLLIRLEKGDIILKSNKKNLYSFQREISNINYPYLLQKAEDENRFLACDILSCFGYDKNINEIKKVIEKRVKTFN